MTPRLMSSIAAGFLVTASALGALLAQGTEAEMANRGGFARMTGHFSVAAGKTWDVLSAIPRIPEELAKVTETIASSSPVEIHPARAVTFAILIGLLVIVIPTLLDRIADAWVQRTLTCKTRFSRALRLIGFDIVAFLISVAGAMVLVHFLFDQNAPIDKFAIALVAASIHWRLAMLAPEILLRPSDSDLRLLTVDDQTARFGVRVAAIVLALGVIIVTIVPELYRSGLSMPAGQAMSLVVGTLMAIVGAYGLHHVLHDAHRALAFLAHVLIFVTWIAWSAGVISQNFEIYHALVWSMAIIAATACLDRLLSLAMHPSDAGAGEISPTRIIMVRALRRVVLAAAGTLVLGLVVRLWLVDVTGMVPREMWGEARRAVITALAVLVAGYISFETLRAWAKAKFGHHYTTAIPGQEDDEEATPASRLTSVLPVLEGVLGVMILATAVLLALSHLGINVAPLIAGAGIFGLALSFGSQALVRDIVAGLFYLFDDAFRVGEYIESGKHKGTVERIALRSVRLRHQNGQIHTLPYGQLGAVTNYSRDYSTIKFNLRLARDTDVEKVRKLVKKLGQELLEDPELGKEFIQPLKLQGLADIQENALVCRFKFTVRPLRPTFVQRAVLNRMYRLLVQNGITFASNAVVVQTPSGISTEMAAAATQATIPQPALATADTEGRQGTRQ